jgi:fibronectin-binding autotransporter adhesin
MKAKMRRTSAMPWSRNLSRRGASCFAAALAAVVGSWTVTPIQGANTEKDVNTNASADLSSSTNYTPSGTPAPTNDTTFKSATYTNTTFTLPSGGSLNTGTLNDLDATQSLTIQRVNTSSTAATLTLNGGTDSVSGSASGDLIFLAPSANLTVQNDPGGKLLNVVLASDGSFDVGSGAVLNISSAISGNFNLTKTGAGTLTLSGANTFGAAKTFTLSAGTLNINNATALGSATDTFQINSGTTINNTSGGLVTLSNNNPLTINGDFTFTGSNALNLGTGATSLGAAAGTSRTITVSASTLTLGGLIGNGTTANSLIKAGSGTLVLSGANTYTGGTTTKGGTILAGNNSALGTAAMLLGDTTGSSNASLLTNGAFTIGNAVTVQSGNTGVMTLGGNTDNNSTFSGAISLNHDLTISQVANAGANALSITGGVSSGTAGTKTVTFAGPGNINVSTTAIANGSGTVAVNVTGGKTTFNVANTYTGGTNVSGGSLFVNNTTGSGTGTGNITVTGSGTTLGGSGTMTGAVSVASGNNLAPGASGVGSTAILKTGALTLSSGSNFQIDLNGLMVGTGYDQLGVTGGASIAGSHLLVTIGTTFIQANVGSQFDILSNITAGAISGQFQGLSEGATFQVGADDFTITYLGNAGDGTNGNDIVLTLTAVPEPSTWVAGGLAFAALLYTQRRRLCSRKLSEFARMLKRAV